MAIPRIDTQGTKLWIDSVNTSYADCTAAITALQAADLVGCPQYIGNIEETRTVTEYKCLTSDESVKALGSVSRGNLTLGLLFDPTDTAGQDALKTAWTSNASFMMGIEFSDNGGTSGTILYFLGGVSGVSTGIPADGAITYDVTIEISSSVTECAATV